MPAISTIIVHIDESRHCQDRLMLAAAVARRCEATLVGLHVAPPASMPLALPGEVSPRWNDAMAKHRQSVLARAEEHFVALQRQMPDAVWQVAEADGLGNIAPVIVHAGRRADLVIVGQNDSGAAAPEGPGAVAQDIVMSVGRPTLVVPHAGRYADIGRRPLIAWTESRESARALYDALPLMRHAEKVQLLEVGAPRASTEEVARQRAGLASVARYLEAHGLTVAVEFQPGLSDIGPAELILSRAADHGADLLVMGAYGHSRLQELVLGGATRSILSSMTLPVLMTH